MDITRFGLIYAGAQKNLGIAGVTLVIIRDDLAARIANPLTPSIFNYSIQIKNKSLYNTPPVFPWYMAGLVVKWLKGKGGLLAIGARNLAKIRTNYIIILTKAVLQKSGKTCLPFTDECDFLLTRPLQRKIIYSAIGKSRSDWIKGHSSLGGIRASLYNAMPEGRPSIN